MRAVGAASPGGALDGAADLRSTLVALPVALLCVVVFFSIALANAAIAAGWLVALVAALAPRRGARAPLAEVLGANRVESLALAGFGVLSVLSGLLCQAPAVAFHVIVTELFSVGIALATTMIRRVRDARIVIWCLLGTGAVAGLWSIVQVLSAFDGVSDPGHRATGFWHLAASVSYGNVMAMLIALTLGVGLWGTRLDLVRAAACGACLAVGSVLSYIRSGWIAIGIGLATVLVWRRMLWVGLVAIMAGAVLLATPLGRVVAARALQTFDMQFEANAERLVRYRIGLDVLADYPVLGTGPGVLRLLHARYARPGAETQTHVHNTYLQLAVERGAVTAMAWAVAFGLTGVRVCRRGRRLPPDRGGLAVGVGLALAALLVVGLFNYVWEDWRVRSIGLVLLGLAWSPALGPSADGPADKGGA